MKLKEGGLISTWLHSLTPNDIVTPTLLGIDGQFTPFTPIEEKKKKEKMEIEEEGDEEEEEIKLGWLSPRASMPPSRLLFLSAGIGITPLMAMLRGIRTANHTEPSVAFLHSERFLEQVPYASELQRRIRTDPNLHFALFLTGKEEVEVGEEGREKKWREETQSKVGVQRGRVDAPALKEQVPDLLDRDVYICGPSAYIEHMKDLVVSLGVSGKAIHTEHFYF